MRRTIIGLAVLALMAVAVTANAAGAEKTTGSVGLSGPTQYVEFNAFETVPVKGHVNYTNFDLATPGTGAWLPAGTFDVDFFFAGGGPYTHTLTVDSFTPLSPTSVMFSGTGFYVPTPLWTETFTGIVDGTDITLTLVPDDGGALYGWTSTSLVGTIAPDGSIAGTWSDTLGRVDSFEIAGAVHEVFHYVAPVTDVSVTAPTASFTYTIPAGLPYAGVEVTMVVADGGSPGAGNDTIGWFGTNYLIVSGNLTVFG